jgi:hypothetical protein
MKNPRHQTLRGLIDSLIESAIGWRILRHPYKGKPGDLVKQLSPEERELLSKATSKDFTARKDDII